MTEKTTKVLKKIMDNLPADYKMVVSPSENGQTMISFEKKNNACVSATVSLEALDKWCDDCADEDLIVNRIIKNVQIPETEGLSNKVSHLRVNANSTNLDFDNVKDLLFCKLVNPKNLSETEIHKDFLDLTMVFRIKLRDDTSIVVTDNIFKKWNISIDDLYEVAKKNTIEMFGINFADMATVICKKIGDPDMEPIVRASFPDSGVPMYILTNNEYTNGAALMFCSDEIQKLVKELDRDLIIIPSSIHDLILIPFEPDIEVGADELRAMINAVNGECLPDDEVLSDHAYYYIRSLNKIIIAD